MSDLGTGPAGPPAWAAAVARKGDARMVAWLAGVLLAGRGADAVYDTHEHRRAVEAARNVLRLARGPAPGGGGE
jgi:hypothetical protein